MKHDATCNCLSASFNKIFEILKFLFATIAIFIGINCFSQKIDSIYVHLYTDSLKKGTYNYINIDGKLSNGSYLPLDSTDLIFWSSDGKFKGNDLYIDPNFKKEKVTVKVVLRSNPMLFRQFDIYIKKIPNPEHLPSVNEIFKSR